MHIRLLLAMLVLVILALGGCSDETTAPTADDGLEIEATAKTAPNIIPSHARPHGKTYGEWSELWWQWMASAPALPDENPVLDTTGDLIDYAQSGPVWFLAGSLAPGVVREAEIPAGKSLFFGLANCEASSREGLGDTEEELRMAAAECADVIAITSFIIDGVEIPIGTEYRIQSDGMFSLTVPEENVFDFWGVPTPAGTYYPSVADGYHVMLTPLPVGDHTIYLSWAFGDFFSGDLTLHLHVTGR